MGSRPLWPLALSTSCLSGSSVALSYSSLQVGEWLWECISSDQGACLPLLFSPSAQPAIFPLPLQPPTPRVSLTCAGCIRESPV